MNIFHIEFEFECTQCCCKYLSRLNVNTISTEMSIFVFKFSEICCGMHNAQCIWMACILIEIFIKRNTKKRKRKRRFHHFIRIYIMCENVRTSSSYKDIISSICRVFCVCFVACGFFFLYCSSRSFLEKCRGSCTTTISMELKCLVNVSVECA